MPQVIQRAPIGLLSLLDSKAGGVAPNLLLDEVRAVFDIEPLFGMSARFSGQSTFVAGDFPGVGPVPVPAGSTLDMPSGQLRHVRYLSAYQNGAAGNNFEFSVGWWDDRNSTYHQHGISSRLIVTGQAGVAGGVADFWQIPGIRPAVFVTSRTTAESVRVTMLYERATF